MAQIYSRKDYGNRARSIIRQMSSNSGATSHGQLTEVTCDWDDVRPTTAIVELVGQLRNRPPTSLTPLYDVIDPDAMNRLFQRDDQSSLSLSFSYEGHEIHVAGTGEVSVIGPSSADN